MLFIYNYYYIATNNYILSLQVSVLKPGSHPFKHVPLIWWHWARSAQYPQFSWHPSPYFLPSHSVRIEAVYYIALSYVLILNNQIRDCKGVNNYSFSSTVRIKWRLIDIFISTKKTTYLVHMYALYNLVYIPGTPLILYDSIYSWHLDMRGNSLLRRNQDWGILRKISSSNLRSRPTIKLLNLVRLKYNICSHNFLY